jgi:VWFA-related protein
MTGLSALSAPLNTSGRLACFAAVCLAAATVSADQQQTFRTGIELVAVDVSARYRGEPILGLTAGDFEVLDNGVPQEVVDVSYGTLPIDVTLAIDISFAREDGFIDRLRKGVADFMTRLGKADRVKLILFNSRDRRAVDFTTDARAIDRAIREAKAASQTGFAETMGEALASASPTDRRHLVLFMTDGAGGSSAKPETVLDLVRRSRATLGIIFPLPLTPGRRSQNLEPNLTQHERTDALRGLAREAGGMIALMTENGDPGFPLRRALEVFQASYVIHFSPSGVEPGGLHTLQVRVKCPDAMVTARRAYIR